MTVFVKKSNKKEVGFNVGVLFNKAPTAGLVGLEIEVEGKSLPKAEETPPPWEYHVDGSLRGAENGEYVLAAPLEFDAVGPALDKLWAAFKKKKSILDDSNRTSVHVHLNCQSFHLNRLTAFMALYYVLEEVLTEWCGEYRVGNLFCLRAKDAPAVISQLRRFIRSDGQAELREGLHYAGLNASALKKFGSLEFRTLRGCTDSKIITDWVNILRRLYDLSAEYPDPRDICAGFSGAGPLAFFNNILGDQASVVRSGVSMTDNDIREAMYDGIRLAQDICYCRDWELFQNMDLVADPFGRDSKKVAKKLLAATDTMGGMPDLMPTPAYALSLSEDSLPEYEIYEDYGEE